MEGHSPAPAAGQPGPAPHPIGIFEAVGGLVLWFYAPEGVQWLLEAIGFTAIEFGAPGSAESMQWRSAMWLSMTGALLLYVRWARGLPLSVIGLRKPNLKREAPDIARLALVAGGVFALLLGVLLLVASVSPELLGGKSTDGAFEIAMRRIGLGIPSLLTIVNVCLIAPIVEEIWFRGWLYPMLRTWLPVWIAVLGSAAVFALAHTDSPIQNFPLSQLIGGIVFAIAYQRTGSLVAPIVLHALGNGSLVVLSLLA